jgi:hypothetical protein
MSFVFPPNPSPGDTFTGPNNVEYTWDGIKWIGIVASTGGGGGGGLLEVETTVTDADVLLAVNTRNVLTISGLTALRTALFPVGAKGDVIEVELATKAPTDYELLLAGDTGVSMRLRDETPVTAAEVTRLFILGEAMRWMHDGTDWVCTGLDDGRIPCSLRADLTTSCDGEAVFTDTVPTSAPTPGAWTVIYDNAGLFTAGSSSATVRRSGIMSASARFYSKDAISFNAKRLFGAIKNTTQATNLVSTGTAQFAGLNADVSAAGQNEVSAGDVLTVSYQTEEGNKGLLANATVITLQEIL